MVGWWLCKLVGSCSGQAGHGLDRVVRNRPSHWSALLDVAAAFFSNPVAQSVPLANRVSDALLQVYLAPAAALAIGLQSNEQ